MPEYDSTIKHADIPGCQGYKACTDGSIWTCLVGHYETGKGRVGVKFVISDKWKMLSPGDKGGGYLVVNIHKKMRRVARLILLSFVGPCPPRMQACHFPDRSPLNNRLDNLRWGTAKENMADKKFHGTLLLGEKHQNSKLTEGDVRAIRKEYDGLIGSFKKLPNGALRNICDKYGISPSTARKIVRRIAWAWLP